MPVYLGKVTETRIEGEVEWRIDDFLSLSDNIDEYYKSPDFRFAAARWSLAIYLHGRSGYSSIGWIGAFLVREDSGHPVALACTLALMTADRKKVSERRFTSLYNEKYCECGTTAILTTSELRKRKLELMPSDVLTVTCLLRRCDTNIPNLHSSSSIQARERLSDKQLSVKKNVPPSAGNLLATVGELTLIRSEGDVEWRIADFFSLSKDIDQFHCSPYLSYFQDTFLSLRIYPNGRSVDNSVGWIGVSVTTVSFDLPGMMSLKLGLKATDGKKEREQHLTDALAKKGSERMFPRFFSRSELMKRKSELVPSGVLTITCSLRYDDPKYLRSVNKSDKGRENHDARVEAATQTEAEFGVNKSDKGRENHDARVEVATQTEAELVNEKLSRDLNGLMLSGDDSDVTVRVKGEEFRLHRCILGARTPVFNSMFRHQMSEKTTGVVSIDDCEADTFRAFLHYVYTGAADRLPTQHVFGLYEVADKYQVDELKADCLECMKNTLSVDTFCDVITLALRHDEKGLMKLATDYFSDRMTEIIVTVKWQTFMSENPTPANELLIKTLVNKNEKN